MIKVSAKTDFITNLTANEFNGIVVETANIIDFTQISPSGAFNTGGDNQMDQAIKYYAQTSTRFAATGSANAITLSTPAPRNSQKAYYDYMEIAFIAPFSNTGPCTITIDTLGSPKSLKNLANADLVAGNIVAGDLITAFYNGTSFLTKVTPRPTSIVKFAVNDASQDAITAEPNFITATGTKEITVDGSAVPIQGTYYEGSAVIISNSQSFDTSALNLATARIVIVEEGIINFNVLDSIITESHLPPIGGVDGDYWIQTNPLKTYKRIAGVWTLTRFVKLGEYPTSASGVVGTIRCYSFNRKTQYLSTAGLTAGTINHNLGTNNFSGEIELLCVTAVAGFTVGRRYSCMMVFNGGVWESAKPLSVKTSTTARFGIGNGNTMRDDGAFLEISGIMANFKVIADLQANY